MSLKQADVQTAYKLQCDADYTYIDVRSIPEFENGHPVGAHNVPLLNLDSRTGQMQPNPDFVAESSEMWFFASIRIICV